MGYGLDGAMVETWVVGCGSDGAMVETLAMDF